MAGILGKLSIYFQKRKLTMSTDTIETPKTIITVNTAELKATLAKFAKVIPSKPSKAVLGGIRIETTATRLALYGTNLELSLHAWVDANEITGGPGGAAVPDYKALVAAVKAIKSDKTRLSVYDQKVIVEDTAGGTTSVTCGTVGGVGDYPVPTELQNFDEAWANRIAGAPEYMKKQANWEKTLESWREELAAKFRKLSVPGNTLAEGLRYVLPGRATGDTRYALGGVFMNTDNRDGIELVTSNTHVLYSHRVPIVSGDQMSTAGFILLPGAAEWLVKHAGNVGEVFVETDPDRVIFRGDSWVFGTRQLDGMFPNYRDVMPDKATLPGNLKVNRKALLDALKTAAPHCNTETRRVDLLPANEGVALEVRVVRSGKTEFSTTIPAASLKCRPVIFDVDYLIDFLAAYPGDVVTLCYDADFKYDGPAVMYDADKAFVAMPLNYSQKNMTEEEKAEYERMIEAYQTALASPDQDFPGDTPAASLPSTKKAPSFKAVVSHAKADPGYMSALLAALGMPAAAAV